MKECQRLYRAKNNEKIAECLMVPSVPDANAADGTWCTSLIKKAFCLSEPKTCSRPNRLALSALSLAHPPAPNQSASFLLAVCWALGVKPASTSACRARSQPKCA